VAERAQRAATKMHANRKKNTNNLRKHHPFDNIVCAAKTQNAHTTLNTCLYLQHMLSNWWCFL